MKSGEEILLNIDKSSWSKVHFGDVVKEVRLSSRNPVQEGLERIIGLEHLEPENIHIKSWGNTGNGTTFTRKFKSGQVLFGRRRAYLKKAALAEFDGVCSGDIIVMESKENLRNDLLPFLVQNEKFFDFAVKNSAGSLSPRVKFKDLAKYEFLLPPKDQQAKIAELLRHCYNIKKAYEKLESSINQYFKTKLKDNFLSLIGKKVAIENILIAQKDLTVGKLDQKDFKERGKFPIIDQGIHEICGYTDNESLVYKGSLPVLIFGDHTTFIKYIDFPFVLGADGTQVLSLNFDLDIKFFYYSLLSLKLKPEGYKRHFSILKNKEIIIPNDKFKISSIVNQLDMIIKAYNDLKNHSNKLNLIMKALIMNYF